MTEPIIINEPNHIMVLKAIDELKFKVGRRFLVNILHGDKTDRLIKHKFHKNKYFGCLELFAKQEIKSLLNELEYKGLIEVKKPDPSKYYTVVCLTEIGKREILNEKGFITKKEIHLNIESITNEDRELFSFFGGFLDGLNDFQKKAVIDNSKYILCVAGAGTGKTAVLTKRIEFLSRLKNVQDDKILAITFTRKARKEMVKRLNKIEGIKCQYPDGAFYTFPNVTALYGKEYNGNIIENDVDVAKFFLEKAHVAVVPGVAFNYSGYVRFVFSKSMEEIKEGLDRIEKAIKELK